MFGFGHGFEVSSHGIEGISRDTERVISEIPDFTRQLLEQDGRMITEGIITQNGGLEDFMKMRGGDLLADELEQIEQMVAQGKLNATEEDLSRIIHELHSAAVAENQAAVETFNRALGLNKAILAENGGYIPPERLCYGAKEVPKTAAERKALYGEIHQIKRHTSDSIYDTMMIRRDATIVQPVHTSSIGDSQLQGSDVVIDPAKQGTAAIDETPLKDSTPTGKETASAVTNPITKDASSGTIAETIEEAAKGGTPLSEIPVKQKGAPLLEEALKNGGAVGETVSKEVPPLFDSFEPPYEPLFAQDAPLIDPPEESVSDDVAKDAAKDTAKDTAKDASKETPITQEGSKDAAAAAQEAAKETPVEPPVSKDTLKGSVEPPLAGEAPIIDPADEIIIKDGAAQEAAKEAPVADVSAQIKNGAAEASDSAAQAKDAAKQGKKAKGGFFSNFFNPEKPQAEAPSIQTPPAAPTLKEEASQAATAAQADVKEAASKAAQSAKESASEAANPIKEGASGFMTSAKSMFKKFINTVKNNKLASAICAAGIVAVGVATVKRSHESKQIANQPK